MKKVIILFFPLCLSFTGFSQSINKRDSLQYDDYSNRPKYDYNRPQVVVKNFKAPKPGFENRIIVIDDKIYQAGSNDLNNIDFKKLFLFKKIIDTSSSSGVKSIYIYVTPKEG